MKVHDSGMPCEEMWSEFFDPQQILSELGLSSDMKAVADMGCGYGTFSIPAASAIQGTVHAFDIEADMLSIVNQKCHCLGIKNISTHHRDFIEDGTGLPGATIDFVMLFNIMHHNQPLNILKEVHRILCRGGKAAILHWRSDVPTPRGPDAAIRPRPDQITRWAEATGFMTSPPMHVGPYHFGMTLIRQ